MCDEHILYVACVACLKRAFFIDPFQWIVCFDLGLVHLCMDQYASAFHYLNATINLKPDWAQSCCFLGVALNRLDDVSNACAAYEQFILTQMTTLLASILRSSRHALQCH
jgi:Bardet-Biedl syndrome 4 protein